jgi:hypothetical protein
MIGALTNHVWQSTVFAVGMGVLTVASARTERGSAMGSG